jgi:hypothetical protein
MQQFSGEKDTPVIRKHANQMLCLTIAVLAMFLSGCAAKTAYRFSSKAVTQISYNPKNCIETISGKFKCKDVVFTVAAIEPVKNK